MRAGSGRFRRGRTGLASVYGFIMIYLLAMASLEAISMSVSSDQQEEAAAQQAGQVSQTRSLERLSVSLSQEGNVTITNDGLIPSEVAFLLLQGAASSRLLRDAAPLAVGATTVVDLPSPPPVAVAVVTSLGDVFASVPSSGPSMGAGTKTLLAGVGGPGVDAQVYQNPSDPSRFFVAAGQTASAYSTATGARLWAFDAGEGEVTDVLPLSDGGVYVSDGYYGDQFTSTLFGLTSSGASALSYTMRLLRLYTTVEVQFPNNGQPPYPVGSQPVQKGADGLFAYYDGWLLSSSGLSSTTIPADTYNLATSDASQFYLYTTGTNPGGFGCTYPRGNIVSLYAYSATSAGVQESWSSTVFLNTCDEYPNYLISSSVGSGLVASIFSQTYWTQPTYYGGPYPGANPFLAVVASSSGTVLRSGTMDSSGYTSIATDGTRVYLSIPSTDQVEVVSASGTGPGTFYNVGMPASSLLWEGGSLFAISPGQVNVYGHSMNLEKSIDFPYPLYSATNSKPFEPQMAQPSFIVLNSTSYLALLRNSTGYGSLVLGGY